jgi:cyclic pyranopterin phosphate synthase
VQDQTNDIQMIDVGAKPVTRRGARARATVRLAPQVLERVAGGTLPKGDALAVCRVAAIMGAKRTPDLVPLCHPIGLTHVGVEVDLDPAAGCVRIDVQCETDDRTGVEMEALTGASAAALCLYDMTKGLDPAGAIESVLLLEKHGGKSGDWRRPDEALA